MDAPESRYQSRRAREIVVETDGFEPEGTAPGVAAQKVQVLKDYRDQFDEDGRQVGVRDSTWLLFSMLALLTIGMSWGTPHGIELFARLLVIGGGVTIATAIGCRKLLAKQ